MRLAPDQSVQYVVGAQSSFGYCLTTDSLGGTGAQFGYFSDGGTGLVLCTHRFYDPSTGRWLTRDPMGYGGGVNLYGYCGNDPGNRVDPSGLDFALPGGGSIPTAGGLLGTGLTLEGIGVAADGTIFGAPVGVILNIAGGVVIVGAVGVILYDKLGGLPMEGGPPDGSLSEDSGVEGGNKSKIRDYGPDGRAKCDYDINHPPKDGPNPHAQDWDWPEDGGPPERSHPGRGLYPGE
jgi:RHS repeat-associated protein